jgi:hypothetical protein
MKTDIIVQRAKTVIHDLGLLHRIEHLKQYTNIENRERYSENDLRRYIRDLAIEQVQMNYTFVEKVLKQINLLLL